MTNSPWTFGDESQSVGAGTVTLVNGITFAICGRSGDLLERGPQGVFVADTRVCSRFELRIDDALVEPLAASVDDPSVAHFVCRSLDRGTIVRRSLRIGHGASFDIELRDRTATDRTIDVAVDVAADLANVFDVKAGISDLPPAAMELLADRRTCSIGDVGARRAALVRCGLDPDGYDRVLRWKVDLPARGRWACRIDVLAIRDGVEVPLVLDPPPEARRRRSATTLGTDVPGLELAHDRALADLDALTLIDPSHPGERVVAAGAPWFMTLFGRDSILTSWMALPVDIELGLSTARTLGRLQGRTTNPVTEEQPGRIVHEVRFGAGSSMSLDDAERYYGTVDATPLFVLLVHELWRWGAAWADIERMLPHVDAALDWMAGDGDPDGDGFIEYARTNDHGLVNQGWKDSWDAICFADGRMATPPIALCEVQAYAYAAWKAGAALAEATSDYRRAALRADRANLLYERFQQAFWLADRACYALALDGDKQPVDALASNLGHLLWCGIVPAANVGAIADALVSPDLASGWGLRTLATSMARYDPLGYHTGSVWPHDTAIAIAGLRRAGCAGEALELATALLAAATASGGRLPELFAGLGPEDLATPVPYPASCSPQAWASASPLLVIRALLGLEPDVPGKRVALDPVLPAGSSQLAIDGLCLAGTSVSLHVDGDAVAVRGLPSGVAIQLRG